MEDMEPELTRTDAIAELAERLRFAFAWILDARRSKSVALRAYVAASYFCPGYIDNETLEATGARLGVTRQAVGKLSTDLRDVLGIKNHDNRRNKIRNPRAEGSGRTPCSRVSRGSTVPSASSAAVLGAWGSVAIKPRQAPESV